MHSYSLRFRKSPHFKNYGSFAAFVVFMFDVILIHFSICRHKGTRSINILEVTNVFSTEERHFWLLRSGPEYRDQSVKNWNLNLFNSWTDRPIRRESKTVCLLGSGFNAVDSGFQVLDSSLHQWNLLSGIQSLVGFRISWAVFRIGVGLYQEFAFHKWIFT